ncbi:XRE family transcriptional regulator [Idiomarina abyssalis]|uniref:XRE family transcriptional regulator n=1 Tax=Idiomarina abyssalis TaxID=86102 RepID=A0A8I1KGZ7_9GAMM|nr:XRE family transcriptional regulator [Idiomarina abyssalis]MBJ7266094.1 XRE family transcriptional regulator [Idiomarina abyssalis]MBJ7272849.1 XRE family transcriptional regulator [Idiomarina abyssalis]MBJ7316233.1 XRE family transcriptional regulator [Idiomarina abyssalis]
MHTAINENQLQDCNAENMRRVSELTTSLIKDDNEAAEYYRMDLKAQLMAFVWGEIEDKGLTQSEAADILDVSQGRVSHLKNIRLDKFRIDNLLIMAYKLGHEFTLKSNTVK